MSKLRSHWYILLAALAGPVAMLLGTAIARADDGWHP